MQRIDAVREILKERKLDALLVANKTNIRYLSGFTGSAGVLFILKKHAFLLTDSRYRIRAKEEMLRPFRMLDITHGAESVFAKFQKKSRLKNIGFEGGTVTVGGLKHYKKLLRGARSWRGARMHDIGGALDALRVAKENEEIRNIARAQNIADRVLSRVRKHLKVGMREDEIAFLIETYAREEGAEGISFPPIVAFGKHSASPHHQSGSARLRKGDMVLIDMGVQYRGYCSDMTRVFFKKKPTPFQREIYELVLQAQETAIKYMRAGVKCAAADKIARDIITKAGYGKHFGHSLGHGIGLQVHEAPSVSGKSKETLHEGSIVTSEPGIYLEGKFGVRIEDMVLIRKNGVKNLTKSKKDIENCLY